VATARQRRAATRRVIQEIRKRFRIARQTGEELVVESYDAATRVFTIRQPWNVRSVTVTDHDRMRALMGREAEVYTGFARRRRDERQHGAAKVLRYVRVRW
jgi:hypothetical protein